MSEGLGWIATAVFSLSYFLTRRSAMLSVQMGAASLWVAYGVLTRAAPVIVANGIVIAAALLSLWRTRVAAGQRASGS
jgi:uncharacterized protein with PQ loop repeat